MDVLARDVERCASHGVGVAGFADADAGADGAQNAGRCRVLGDRERLNTVKHRADRAGFSAAC